MALTVVLWGIAMLSIIAVSFLLTSSASYRVARNSVEIAKWELVAEAAVARAVLSLLDSRPDKRWRIDGVAQNVEIDGMTLTISVEDELGRIDLNHADSTLLVRLFQSAGLDTQAAGRLVDSILDWRGSHIVRSSNVAVSQPHPVTGYQYRPRRGAFQSVDELKLVIGMTPALFERSQLALTVYSGNQFFDPRTAPREALLALPATDAEKVATAMTARAQLAPQSVAGAATLAGRAFTIRTEIVKPDTIQVHEAVVRLTDDPTKPYWLLHWKFR